MQAAHVALDGAVVEGVPDGGRLEVPAVEVRHLARLADAFLQRLAALDAEVAEGDLHHVALEVARAVDPGAVHRLEEVLPVRHELRGGHAELADHVLDRAQGLLGVVVQVHAHAFQEEVVVRGLVHRDGLRDLRQHRVRDALQVGLLALALGDLHHVQVVQLRGALLEHGVHEVVDRVRERQFPGLGFQAVLVLLDPLRAALTAEQHGVLPGVGVFFLLAAPAELEVRPPVAAPHEVHEVAREVRRVLLDGEEAFEHRDDLGRQVLVQAAPVEAAVRVPVAGLLAAGGVPAVQAQEAALDQAVFFTVAEQPGGGAGALVEHVGGHHIGHGFSSSDGAPPCRV